MNCGVAVAFYCLYLAFVFAPWRAGCSRRSRRANLPLSLAFSLTDGRARCARCALVAFAIAPWRADDYAPLQARTMALFAVAQGRKT